MWACRSATADENSGQRIVSVNGALRKDLARVRGCPLRVDTVEKGFWEGSPSNIDLRWPPMAKYWFKKAAYAIRSLRRHAWDFLNSIGHEWT